jgi:hypothetical protein
MNGQVKGIDEPFIEPKTGQKMKFAGDTSLGASGGNTINCRCTQVYQEI